MVEFNRTGRTGRTGGSEDAGRKRFLILSEAKDLTSMLQEAAE
jgi:hypothetical protein